MEKVITENLLKEYSEEFKKCPEDKIIANAIRKNGVFNVAFNSDSLKDLKPNFNIEVKDCGAVTNQKQSGRCWMFAGLNVLRKVLIKNLKVDDCELSESYLMFYDKLEKSNSMLEEVISHIDEKDNSRLLDSITLGLGGDNDGGYWNYFVNLVKKYGVCPKDVMGESVSSSSSGEMDYLLNVLLNKDVATLRHEYEVSKDIEKLRELKCEMLKDIYKVLAMCLGEPVKEFDYTFKAKEDKKEDDKKEEKSDEKKESSVNELKVIHKTPLEFFKEFIGVELDEYISLVNWPLKSLKEYTPYSCKYINNVKGSDNCIFLNLPINELKESAIKSLKDSELCWFACDVSSSSLRRDGYLSTEILPLDDVFKVKFGFDKGDRLMLRASTCNHAMTLSGVNLDKDEKPTIWKVTNSWGKDLGFDGIYIMSDKWFDEYVYEVVVKKSKLSDKAKEALSKEPVELEPWSPVL